MIFRLLRFLIPIFTSSVTCTVKTDDGWFYLGTPGSVGEDENIEAFIFSSSVNFLGKSFFKKTITIIADADASKKIKASLKC